MNNLKILIVGCGKMGFSLLQGFINSGALPENILVIEPHSNEHLEKLKVKIQPDAKNIPADFDFCIFAVKPQNFDDVIKNYSSLANGNCVFLSIAAGKTIAKMQSLLGAKAPIARAMPNLPATVGVGVTAVCFNAISTTKQQHQTIKLLESVGEVVTIKNEDQLDVITAISGSGPAYIFHIIESLYNIGVKSGLDEDVALKLATHTVYGSGKLAVESDKSPETLRCDVTSPGGTTEAALKVLMDDKKLETLFSNAIKAAEKRSKELAS